MTNFAIRMDMLGVNKISVEYVIPASWVIINTLAFKTY